MAASGQIQMSGDANEPNGPGGSGPQGTGPGNNAQPPVPTTSKSSGGFFGVYKRGQGYLTRLGTAAGGALVALFFAYFAYTEAAILELERTARLGIAAGVFALIGLVIWWIMNGPRRAQFLIDTDAEMKKVNWSGRSELIGATRVVIIFMLTIAFLLFGFDTLYHLFFYSIDIWKISPLEVFGIGGTPAPPPSLPGR